MKIAQTMQAAIPLIVAACEIAPAEAAGAIAARLLYFHTPEADTAAKRFLPPELVK